MRPPQLPSQLEALPETLLLLLLILSFPPLQKGSFQGRWGSVQHFVVVVVVVSCALLTQPRHRGPFLEQLRRQGKHEFQTSRGSRPTSEGGVHLCLQTFVQTLPQSSYLLRQLLLLLLRVAGVVGVKRERRERESDSKRKGRGAGGGPLAGFPLSRPPSARPFLFRLCSSSFQGDSKPSNFSRGGFRNLQVRPLTSASVLPPKCSRTPGADQTDIMNQTPRPHREIHGLRNEGIHVQTPFPLSVCLHASEEFSRSEVEQRNHPGKLPLSSLLRSPPLPQGYLRREDAGL
mmetsp:Transcript_13705/g.27263  ORF Transcript_13705/g.27263 Transcript_13705/m.27263 type:complete len:289 (-) Transcript_13705:76-942(-)